MLFVNATNVTIHGDVQVVGSLFLNSTNTLFVLQGNLTFLSTSSVYLSSSAMPLFVNGCVSFDGNLHLSAPDLNPGEMQDILISNFSCHFGAFNSVTLDSSDPCVIITPVYSPTDLRVLLSEPENCGNNEFLDVVVPVIASVILLITIIIGIIAVILFNKKGKIDLRKIRAITPLYNE